MLVPRLGDEHQQSVVQVAAGHLEQFQCVIQTGRVAVAGVGHRRYLGHIIAEQGGLELGLPGVHPVDVAPEGVDFAVVGQVPVGVGQAPTAQGVGAEAGVDQRKSADQVLVLQVQVELGYLVGHEQALIYYGIARHATDIEAVDLVFGQARLVHGMLKGFADDKELPL